MASTRHLQHRVEKLEARLASLTTQFNEEIDSPIRQVPDRWYEGVTHSRLTNRGAIEAIAKHLGVNITIPDQQVVVDKVKVTKKKERK